MPDFDVEGFPRVNPARSELKKTPDKQIWEKSKTDERKGWRGSLWHQKISRLPRSCLDWKPRGAGTRGTKPPRHDGEGLAVISFLGTVFSTVMPMYKTTVCQGTRAVVICKGNKTGPYRVQNGGLKKGHRTFWFAYWEARQRPI